MSEDITVRTNDITDQNVSAITIMASARGYFDDETVREALRNAGLSESQMPGHVGLNTALRRAMQDISRGNKAQDVKSKGRGNSAVFTVMTTNLDALDLEVNSGLGVADAEVSARIQVDPGNSDSYQLRISPPDHWAAREIRERFDLHCGRMSATYDLKVWWTQKFLPGIGAMRTGRALGEYVVSATPSVVETLTKVKDALATLPSTGKFRTYLTGECGDSADAVDMITDAILDEAERVAQETSIALNKNVGIRGLESQSRKAVALHDRLEKLGKSFGVGLEDVDSVINVLQIKIGVSMAKIATAS